MTVSGRTNGLKADQIRRLSRLAQRRMKSDEVISPDFAASMVALSLEIKRQIGLLIGRDGTVYSVLVGNERSILIPNISQFRFGKGRLRGVRWVHTHLKNEPLTQDDLTDLSLLQFDLVAAIGLLPNGTAGSLYVAHLLPPNPEGKVYESLPPRSVHHPFDLPLAEFLSALDAEFEVESSRVQRGADPSLERVMLVSVSKAARLDIESSLDELADLARSARLAPIDRVIQRPQMLHPKYLLGQGKLKEVIVSARQQQIDLLIFDQPLTPLQTREIGKVTEMKVIDRTQLILDIFAQRAKTREAKVQVELAQLKHQLPRLSDRSTALSRLTGGIGGRGPGETRLEIDLRRARDRVTRLEHEHETLSQARGRRRVQRAESRLPIFSIVGYTNAGKSTLLNALTASDIATGNRLFETLDTTTRRLRFPREREVILTDTVGFIHALPDDLMGAFRSTLDELRDACLLIHLVDISHPRFAQQMAAVTEVLSELELEQTPCLLVFNKIDRVDPDEVATLCERYAAVAVSALRPESLKPLLAELELRVG
jgi:GTP-binding protein HflX